MSDQLCALFIPLVVVGGVFAQQADPVMLELGTLVQQKKFPEAIQLANSLGRKSSPSLISVDKRLSVSSRLFAEVALASLDSNSAQKHKQWLEQGDKAFADGDFQRAQMHWQWQDSLKGAGADWLGIPKTEPALPDPALWYRQLLLRSFLEFPSSPAPEEIREFLESHGDSRGTFKGKSGTYRDLLEDLEGVRGLVGIVTPTHPRIGADRNPASSHGPTPYGLASWCSPGPWVKHWLGANLPNDSPKLDLKADHRAIHPAPMLLGNELYYHDETSLSVQDLKSGKVKLLWGEPSGRVASLATGESSLTRTRENLLLAILRVKPHDLSTKVNTETRLVCVEAGPGGGRLIFSLSPPGESAWWEAGPVILENRAFVLLRSKDQGRESSRVYCYNLAARNPDLLWSAELPQDSNPDPRAQLPFQIAGAGDQLFISTSSRLYAVQVENGGIQWTRSYPSDKLKHPASSRNRLVFGNGKVYHSASRAGWVECLDATTGRILWKREMGEDVCLLGICSGNLLLEPSRGLRALNQNTGNDAPGWFTPADFGNIHSIGRGFFVGRHYFWPTNQGHLVVHCPTGRPGADPTLFLKLGPGSMTLSPGGLILFNESRYALYPNPGQWELKEPPVVNQVNPLR